MCLARARKKVRFVSLKQSCGTQTVITLITYIYTVNVQV